MLNLELCIIVSLKPTHTPKEPLYIMARVVWCIHILFSVHKSWRLPFQVWVCPNSQIVECQLEFQLNLYLNFEHSVCQTKRKEYKKSTVFSFFIFGCYQEVAWVKKFSVNKTICRYMVLAKTFDIFLAIQYNTSYLNKQKLSLF